jgi:hypothetical protein
MARIPENHDKNLPAIKWESFMNSSSRGDWTPLELFLAGVRDGDAELRRFFVGSLDD